MMRIRTLTLKTLLGTTLLGLTLASCSNDKAKENLGGVPATSAGGAMSIVACSLGCNTFQTSQISCTVNNVFVNEEIRITFSQPVNLTSLKTSTFQVRDTANGLMPPGAFSPDPSDPRGVIYRPLLTFNSSGSPVFGLEAGHSYEIFLPGTNQDAGPYITSVGGKSLGTRMRCIVTAGGGINDPVSGAPTVLIRVNEILKDAFGIPVIDPNTNAPFLGALVPADNAIDIHRSSKIEFTFNDVMNPATLVNKVTGLSPSLRIFVDPDGDVSDPSDWVELFGFFDLLIDQTKLTTTVIFDPDTDYPSAGPVSQVLPRRIIVSVPTTVVDLGGNSVANASDVTFVPERIIFSPQDLPESGGEAFTTTATQVGHREDTTRSGAFWGPTFTLNNELEPGIGGGSGRLGDLVLGSGEILTLYTDGMRPRIGQESVADGADCGQVDLAGVPQLEAQLFGPDGLVHDQDGTFATIGRETSLACLGGTTDPDIVGSVLLPLVNDSRNITAVLIDNYDPATTTPGTSSFQVTDGIFEFASLDIAPGAVLRFVGPNAARLFVRGEAVLRGRIELNGEDADQDHSAQSDLGGVGANAGPGGGSGGNGGLRPSGGGVLLGVGASATTGYPGGTVNALVTPGLLTDLDGSPGEGFKFPSGNPAMPLELGGGPGGIRWPLESGAMMVCSAMVPTDCGIPDGTAADLTFTGGLFFTAVSGCQTGSMGGPGGGGGRSRPGGPGIPALLDPMDDPNSIPPATGAGSQLNDAVAPALAPHLGHLTGGSGGGGSGGHAHGTSTGPMGAMACDGTMISFVSNSGAGGGGGGGALQFQAGARLVLDGVIDATGGRGGEPFDVTPSATADFTPGFVSPGGAGSGGSILIQTLNLLLPALSNRLDINGGVTSTGLNNSIGGAGSQGFVHVQTGISGISVPALLEIARVVNPFDMSSVNDLDYWVSVNSVGWRRIVLNAVPAVHPLTNTTLNYVPESISGAQSCWMRPEGNFFTLRFIPDDDGGNGLPGWTMDVRLDPNEAVVPLSYRVSTLVGGAANPVYATSIEGAIKNSAFGANLTSKLQDPEATVGGTFGSQFIVRFQGARAIKDIADFCDVPLTGAGSPIQPGSVTPWVLHPAELNDYWETIFPSASFPGEAAKRAPTMIRYQVIFNRRAKLFGFAGVDNITIKVQPD